MAFVVNPAFTNHEDVVVKENNNNTTSKESSMEEIKKIDNVTSSRGAQWTLAGTGIGLLATAVLGGGGWGGLGGLFGGGANAATAGAGALALNAMAEKDAKIAELTAENYSDKVAKETYTQSLVDNRNLREEVTGTIKPMLEAISAQGQRIATLEAEQKCDREKAFLREEIVRKDIQIVKQEMTCCCTQNASAIAQVQAILGNITKLVVPNSSICPGWGNVTITTSPATTTTTNS